MEETPIAANDSLVMSSTRKGIQWRKGAFLEALDSWNKWCMAKIVDIVPETEKVLIHFYKWNSRFDTWYPMSSPSLRPYVKKSSTKQSATSNTEITTKPTDKKETPSISPVTRSLAPVTRSSETLPEVVSAEPQPTYKVGDYVLSRWRNKFDYVAIVKDFRKQKSKGSISNSSSPKDFEYSVQYLCDNVLQWVTFARLKPCTPEQAQVLMNTIPGYVPEEPPKRDELFYDEPTKRFTDQCRDRRRRQRESLDGITPAVSEATPPRPSEVVASKSKRRRIESKSSTLSVEIDDGGDDVDENVPVGCLGYPASYVPDIIPSVALPVAPPVATPVVPPIAPPVASPITSTSESHIEDKKVALQTPVSSTDEEVLSPGTKQNVPTSQASIFPKSVTNDHPSVTIELPIVKFPTTPTMDSSFRVPKSPDKVQPKPGTSLSTKKSPPPINLISSPTSNTSSMSVKPIAPPPLSTSTRNASLKVQMPGSSALLSRYTLAYSGTRPKHCWRGTTGPAATRKSNRSPHKKFSRWQTQPVAPPQGPRMVNTPKYTAEEGPPPCPSLANTTEGKPTAPIATLPKLKVNCTLTNTIQSLEKGSLTASPKIMATLSNSPRQKYSSKYNRSVSYSFGASPVSKEVVQHPCKYCKENNEDRTFRKESLLQKHIKLYHSSTKSSASHVAKPSTPQVSTARNSKASTPSSSTRPQTKPSYESLPPKEELEESVSERASIVFCGRCGGRQEHEVMIQCDICLTWAHMACYQLCPVGGEGQPPEYWECDSCAGHLRPVRPSRRSVWRHDWLSTGKMPWEVDRADQRRLEGHPGPPLVGNSLLVEAADAIGVTKCADKLVRRLRLDLSKMMPPPPPPPERLGTAGGHHHDNNDFDLLQLSLNDDDLLEVDDSSLHSLPPLSRVPPTHLSPGRSLDHLPVTVGDPFFVSELSSDTILTQQSHLMDPLDLPSISIPASLHLSGDHIPPTIDSLAPITSQSSTASSVGLTMDTLVPDTAISIMDTSQPLSTMSIDNSAMDSTAVSLENSIQSNANIMDNIPTTNTAISMDNTVMEDSSISMHDVSSIPISAASLPLCSSMSMNVTFPTISMDSQPTTRVSSMSIDTMQGKSLTPISLDSRCATSVTSISMDNLTGEDMVSISMESRSTAPVVSMSMDNLTGEDMVSISMESQSTAPVVSMSMDNLTGEDMVSISLHDQTATGASISMVDDDVSGLVEAMFGGVTTTSVNTDVLFESNQRSSDIATAKILLELGDLSSSLPSSVPGSVSSAFLHQPPTSSYSLANQRMTSSSDLIDYQLSLAQYRSGLSDWTKRLEATEKLMSTANQRLDKALQSHQLAQKHQRKVSRFGKQKVSQEPVATEMDLSRVRLQLNLELMRLRTEAAGLSMAGSKKGTSKLDRFVLLGSEIKDKTSAGNR